MLLLETSVNPITWSSTDLSHLVIFTWRGHDNAVIEETRRRFSCVDPETTFYADLEREKCSENIIRPSVCRGTRPFVDDLTATTRTASNLTRGIGVQTIGYTRGNRGKSLSRGPTRERTQGVGEPTKTSEQ